MFETFLQFTFIERGFAERAAPHPVRQRQFRPPGYISRSGESCSAAFERGLVRAGRP